MSPGPHRFSDAGHIFRMRRARRTHPRDHLHHPDNRHTNNRRNTVVFRVYVEKKPGFDVEARQLENELKTILGIKGLTGLRIVNRYDV